MRLKDLLAVDKIVDEAQEDEGQLFSLQLKTQDSTILEYYFENGQELDECFSFFESLHRQHAQAVEHNKQVQALSEITLEIPVIPPQDSGPSVE